MRTHNQVGIRNATVADAPELTEIAIASKAYWGYSDEFIKQCREELSVTSQDIETDNLIYVVAERDEQLLGFFALERLSADEMELEALFVRPDYIGQGIGRRLMDEARLRAADDGVSCLKIQSDPYAEPFYRAAGAVTIGRKESDSIPGRYLPMMELQV